MFTKILLVCLLAFPIATMGNELPEAPAPKASAPVEATMLPSKEYRFNRKLYAGEMAVEGAAIAADEITTVHTIYKPGQFETNPVLGKHPSELRITAYGAAEFAIAGVVGYVAEHNRHKAVRFAGRALIAGSVFNHAQAATCNATRNINATCANYPVGLF